MGTKTEVQVCANCQHSVEDHEILVGPGHTKGRWASIVDALTEQEWMDPDPSGWSARCRRNGQRCDCRVWIVGEGTDEEDEA